jgi:hypothetical protein
MKVTTIDMSPRGRRIVDVLTTGRATSRPTTARPASGWAGSHLIGCKRDCKKRRIVIADTATVDTNSLP